METDKYYAEVEKQHRLLQTDPAKFRASFDRWIVLGYILLVIVLAVLLAMLVGAFFLYRIPNLALLVGAAAFFGLAGFAGAMFTSWKDTESIEFTRAQAPEIWKRLDKYCQLAGLKKVDQLLLNDDYNASASLQGRFIFGPQKIVVTLGVPLLCLHAPEEVDAVLVHEFAHHINQDTNASHRSHRIGRLWGGLAENSRGMTKWIDWLARWYWRRLSAKQEVSSRPAEFAADKLAAQVVGQDAIKGTLFRTPINGMTRMSTAYKNLDEAVRQGQEIENHFITKVLAGAKQPVDNLPYEEVTVELRKFSHENDSHPTLRERLDNIGIQIDPDNTATVQSLVETYAAPLNQTALEAYFPNRTESVLALFDQHFAESRAEGWESYVEKNKEDTIEQRRLEEKLAAHDISPDDEVRLLDLKAESHGLLSVEQEIDDLYQRHPDNSEVLTLYARLKAEQKDPACLDATEKLEKDPKYRMASFSIANSYFSAIGDSTKEREYEILAAREYESLSEAYARFETDKLGPIEPLELDPEIIADIKRIAHDDPEIQIVFAFARVDQERPYIKQPLLVLLVKYKGVVFNEENRLNEVYERFQKQLPRMSVDLGTYAITLKHPFINQIKKAKQPGMVIYQNK